MNPLFFYKIYSYYIVPATALFPIYFGLKNYKLLPSAFKILLTFIIISSLFNIVNLIAIRAYKVQTVTWVPVYTVLEFAFITLIYCRIFDKKWRPAMYALIICFAAACAVNAIFIQNKVEFNTYTRPVGALFIVGFCMNYIIKTGTIESNWADNKFNWVNIGMLLYYSSGLVMFTFSNYFLTASSLSLLIWTIHNTILITEYVLFGVGYYKHGITAKVAPKKY